MHILRLGHIYSLQETRVLNIPTVHYPEVTYRPDKHSVTAGNSLGLNKKLNWASQKPTATPHPPLTAVRFWASHLTFLLVWTSQNQARSYSSNEPKHSDVKGFLGEDTDKRPQDTVRSNVRLGFICSLTEGKSAVSERPQQLIPGARLRATEAGEGHRWLCSSQEGGLIFSAKAWHSLTESLLECWQQQNDMPPYRHGLAALPMP